MLLCCCLVLSSCRHYLDFLLVCVVALCTLENDMLHAGYLALALAFFRSRIALRIKRNRQVAHLELSDRLRASSLSLKQAKRRSSWQRLLLEAFGGAVLGLRAALLLTLTGIPPVACLVVRLPAACFGGCLSSTLR